MRGNFARGMITAGVPRVLSAGGRRSSRKLVRSQRDRRRAGLWTRRNRLVLKIEVSCSDESLFSTSQLAQLATSDLYQARCRTLSRQSIESALSR